MAEPHLDHPGEIRWYGKHTPVPMLGPCTHAQCGHMDCFVVANGPDMRRYTLDQCIYCGCRAWASSRGVQWGTWMEPVPVEVRA